MEFETLGEDTALASISTFSGGGIGDLGIERGCGVPVISACEIVPDRAGLIRHNYPDTRVFQGDIWEMAGEICQHSLESLDGRRPWLVVLSPPCQGMSSNGAGRISTAIREGRRPAEDERNRLVIPGVRIVENLQPDWFILENVRRMENTVITNEDGEPENILDLLARRLHPLGYTIRSSIIDFRDLGVPHHRQRLITVGCRLSHIVESTPPGTVFHTSATELHPAVTHGGEDQPAHVTMREAIGHMPSLDSRDKLVDETDSYHQIPQWNENHYFWMEHTPEGETAFNNMTCPDCGSVESEKSSVSCGSCESTLPRPQKRGEDGAMRLIRGFKTSYRRLKWDSPASTITQNSGVISSDMKGHPEQNRVLSVREILLLSTLQEHPGTEYPWDGHYQFTSKREDDSEFYDGEFTPKLVRQVIGESIPPLAMARIVRHIMKVDGRMSHLNDTQSLMSM